MPEPRKRPYRLGIDVGTNSLGWFVIWLDDRGDPCGLGPGGVRIFPDGRDPQSGTSNAASRRTARGQRRRRDRYLDRRGDLMKALVTHGLMLADPAARKALEHLDPYELRAKALGHALSLHHIGRAIFHLNQRRGFKSNRKSDKADNERGAIKEAASKLQTAMKEEGARTLGEFLWHRHQNRETVRARNIGSAAKASYDFYPTRDLLDHEFDAIWRAQARHHHEMTDEARAAIRETIFFQRPLKSPPVGKCALDPAQTNDDSEGFRCPWAHPLAQRFRIWQEVRNLAVSETGQPSRFLTKEEGDRIALALFQIGKVSFDKIRTLLRLPDTARFNLESERRPELVGDETAAKLSRASLFGKAWRGHSLDRQVAIVEKLLDEEDEGTLIEWLQSKCDLDADVAGRVANAILPQSHSRLGLRAIKAMLPHLEAGKLYHDAANAAGYDHAQLPTGEILDRLPYYGEWLKDDVVGSGDETDTKEKRWGRFPNPTVHIGLGQLRRVVNSLVRELGAPDEVIVELARDLKLSAGEKKRIEREQTDNEKRNMERRKLLAEQGQPDNPRNLLKMRLWEELNPKDPLDRRCPFSGEQIGVGRLFSDEVEIEHLIPFSVSWDDSAANKVVCMRYANRAKQNRPPHDAFGSSPSINGHRYLWAEIAERADTLPNSKRWRFQPDALARFDAMGGFLGRQLNETRWLARLAKGYLTAITNPNKVWVIPGQLTAMIRGKWGLNALLPDHNFTDAKNRADHRHHAIDALVAGLTDRGLLNKMARVYDEERARVEIPLPWPTLRDDLKAKLDVMTVSHKPDHSAQGKLHEDTAYGFVREPAKEDGNLVYRKALIALNENEIGRIRDLRLRAKVAAHVEGAKGRGVKLADALAEFAKTDDDPQIKHGLRRVRLVKSEKPEYLVGVGDANGNIFKSYSAGDNSFVDIYELSDGKWDGEAATVFQANQKRFQPAGLREHPGAKLVMRLHKGDLVRVEHDGRAKIMVVHRLDAAAGSFKLAEHNEAGNLNRRHGRADDPFRWLMASYNTLKKMKAERVRVDELGCVWRIRSEEAARTLQRAS